MFLKLTDSRCLKSDNYCFKLCKLQFNKKKGKDEWKPYKYYGSLENAAKLIPEQFLRESDATGIQEVISTLRELEELMSSKLEERS